MNDFKWDEDKEYISLSCGLYFSVSPLLNEDHSIHKIYRILQGIHSTPYQKNMHIMQLQTAGMNDQQILGVAKDLHEMCRNFGIVFLIDDRLDLVQPSSADGIYISKREESSDTDYIARCRSQLGTRAIIGVNCGNSQEEAIAANDQKIVDFVVFESFFTPPHYLASKAKLEMLAWWSTYTDIPSAAKGYITADNMELLVKEGVDFLCCDSFIWKHPKPEIAVVEVMNKIANALEGKSVH